MRFTADFHFGNKKNGQDNVMILQKKCASKSFLDGYYNL